MAETLHQYKTNGLPKAPFEEVEGSSIDDDCSIRTAQISNVRRVTLSPTMSGEGIGGSNQDQQEDAQLRAFIRGLLNDIIGDLSENQRSGIIRTLQSIATDTDRQRFQEIFARCRGQHGNVERLHSNYIVHPDIFASLVSIEAERLRTDRARRQRANQLEAQQAAQQARQGRMLEVSNQLGEILQRVAVNGNQVAHIVESLMYRAVDRHPLTLNILETIVQEGQANFPENGRELANQFVGTFNRDLVESGEELARLDSEIANIRSGRGPEEAEEVGPAREGSVSSLSDDIGLHVSRDSSSSHREPPPWLGRYFGGVDNPS